MNKSPFEVEIYRTVERPGVMLKSYVDYHCFEQVFMERLGETINQLSDKIVEEVSKDIGDKLKDEIIKQIDQKALATMVLAKVAANIAEGFNK